MNDCQEPKGSQNRGIPAASGWVARLKTEEGPSSKAINGLLDPEWPYPWLAASRRANRLTYLGGPLCRGAERISRAGGPQCGNPIQPSHH